MIKRLASFVFLLACVSAVQAQLTVLPSSGGGTAQTNILVENVTDAGNAAYSNATAFALSSSVVTTNNLVPTNFTGVLNLTNAANAFGGSGASLTAIPLATAVTGTLPLSSLPTPVLTNNQSTATTFSNNVTVDAAHRLINGTIATDGANLTNVAFKIGNPYFAGISTAYIGFNSGSDPSSGSSVYLYNESSGVFQINNGGVNAYRDLKLRNLTAVSGGSITSVDGFSSTSTTAAVDGGTGGYTNAMGKVAVCEIDGIGLTYTIYNNAGTAMYTNPATVIHAEVLLQNGGKVLVTAGTGVTTRARPF